MELIERYLQAVKFWLPTDQKQDIIAELSDDIQAEVDEQESRLGRKVNEAEVEGLLKKRGSPVLVANRYLPQEHLIGPVLFPIYRFVLKIVLVCCLAPWALTWLGLTFFQSGNGWVANLASIWGSLWLTVIVAMGMVTLAFAILERIHAKSHFFENWNPRKLPAVRNPNLIPRSASCIELGANLVFFVWWAGNMASPVVLDRPEARIVLSSLWPYFYWGFLLLALANAILAAVNLMRPYWTGPRATLRLLSDCVGSALFCWLMKANILASMTLSNVSVERGQEITNAINQWMGRLFPFVVLVGIVIVLSDLYRILRPRTNGLGVARQATVITTLPL